MRAWGYGAGMTDEIKIPDLEDPKYQEIIPHIVCVLDEFGVEKVEGLPGFIQTHIRKRIREYD